MNTAEESCRVERRDVGREGVACVCVCEGKWAPKGGPEGRGALLPRRKSVHGSAGTAAGVCAYLQFAPGAGAAPSLLRPAKGAQQGAAHGEDDAVVARVQDEEGQWPALKHMVPAARSQQP